MCRVVCYLSMYRTTYFVLLDAIYVCEIYNLCYVCDTLCFGGNGIFVIQVMCVMNTSKKEQKT
jgi:hypothetical protein